MKEFTRDELSDLLLDTFDFPQNEIDATTSKKRFPQKIRPKKYLAKNKINSKVKLEFIRIF